MVENQRDVAGENAAALDQVECEWRVARCQALRRDFTGEVRVVLWIERGVIASRSVRVIDSKGDVSG